jgi:hypothetical protein
MSSILKVDTIQDQNGNNIINENANTITIGASGDTITIPSGATLSSTDPLVFPAGTVSLPSITTTGDLNTGIFFPAADEIALTEGGVEGVRLNSSGNVQFAKNIGLGGATPTTSGTGITFPATASGSTNANTLDDYEEGTFTPQLGGTTTNPSVVYDAGTTLGAYIKIGRQVTISGQVRTASGTTGGTGGLTLKNLPFATSQIGSERGYVGNVLTYNIDTPANALYIGLFNDTGSDATSFSFLCPIDNGVWEQVEASTLSSVDIIIFTITYYTA